MFRLRTAQKEQLTASAQRDFAERLAVHLGRFFPEQCEALGPDATLAAMTEGVARAREHGFLTERQICLFVDLTFSLGRGFDSSVQYPWATQILADRASDPTARINRLFDAALLHARSAARIVGH